MKKTILVSILVFVILLCSCTSSKQIQRVDPNTQYDLSEGWNDTDFRLASQNLVDSCLDGAWLTKYLIKNDSQAPVVIVGNIRNLTSDHIDTSILSKKMEVVMVNSGEVETVADQGFRDDIRDEQLDQQYHSSAETAVQIGNETGAKYMLQGSIKFDQEAAQNESVRTYYIDAELIDLESAKKVWMGYYEIKKEVKRSKLGW